MTDYLLGRLSVAEREPCEEEWFTDQAKYYELCEAENALIDGYVRGDLSSEDRALFEQHFLTIPARRERVKIAEVLVHEIDKRAAQSESWSQRLILSLRAPKLIPAIAMAVLLLAGGLWFYSQNRQLREQVATSATTVAEQQRRVQELEQSLANERATNARLTEELARPQSTGAPPDLPTTLLFTLTAGVLRGDSSETLRTLKLSKDIERVQLQVALPTNAFTHYDAILRTAEGREIMRWKSVKAANAGAGARLTLGLPARNLNAGDYVLVISGINANHEAEEFRRLSFKLMLLSKKS